MILCYNRVKNNGDTKSMPLFYGKLLVHIGGCMIKTLEEALNYISELEAENKALRASFYTFPFSLRNCDGEQWLMRRNASPK